MFTRSRVLCLTGKKLALRFIAPVLVIGHHPPYVHLASTWHHSCDRCSQAFPVFRTLPLPRIILNANRRTKNRGGLGTRLVFDCYVNKLMNHISQGVLCKVTHCAGRCFSLASFPGHTQIFSPQLWDKIWEWPETARLFRILTSTRPRSTSPTPTLFCAGYKSFVLIFTLNLQM